MRLKTLLGLALIGVGVAFAYPKNQTRALLHTLKLSQEKIGTMERITLRRTAKLPEYTYMLDSTGYGTYAIKTVDGQTIGTYRIISIGNNQLRIVNSNINNREYAGLKLTEADKKFLNNTTNPEVIQRYVNNLNQQLQPYGYRAKVVQRQGFKPYKTIKLIPIH